MALKTAQCIQKHFGSLFLKHVSILCLCKEMKMRILVIIILVMVVIIVTRLWGWMKWSSNPGTNKDFVSSSKPSYLLRPHLTWYYLPSIKRPESKFDHSLPSIAKIKKGLNCKSALLYALTACTWAILLFGEIMPDRLQCALQQLVYLFVITFLF